MGHLLRKILFVFFCFSVGGSLFAATASFFEKDTLEFVDPRLAKIHADFHHQVNDELELPASNAPYSPGVIEQLAYAPTLRCFHIVVTDSQFYFKKQYLFTYSGTSPPFLS
jgi:hypothetical protein